MPRPSRIRKLLKGRRGRVVMLALAAVILAGYPGAKWLHRRSVENRIAEYRTLINKHAKAFSLPAALVRSVIRSESGGQAEALSPRNARGLMQITPQTEQEVVRRQGLKASGDLYEPDYNIYVGCAYLRQLLDRFDGDTLLAVAAYNMGPTRLADLRANNPGLSSEQLIDRFAPPATQTYCRKVLEGL